MGHRAQKSRLRHGYVTTTSGSGIAMSYKTDRPPFTEKKGSKNKSTAYKNVGPVVWVKPKREKWSARHKKTERKAAA